MRNDRRAESRETRAKKSREAPAKRRSGDGMNADCGMANVESLRT